MVHGNNDTFAFAFRAVTDKAPNASGVYTIHTSRRWLYVGESDDIKQSLFAHLNAPGGCLARRGPLSFSFEAIAPEHRVDRRQALVTALAPACNPIRPTDFIEAATRPDGAAASVGSGSRDTDMAATM
jgi:hypothetical protein